jgi:predicted anti-sigma-YlaC factor YlaD
MTEAIAQLSCQELVELVTDYLEGVLREEERTRFDHHLEGCSGCSEYLVQMRQTIELTGELRPSDLTPAAEEALLTAFRDWKAG